jgi:hypothetical protein
MEATRGALPPIPPEYREPETRWYGYQNMLADLGGVVIGGLAISAQSGELAGLAVATYAFGSPAVHWAHGNVGKGFGSLGLRIVAPAVGAGLGCLADNSHGDYGCLGGLAGGVLVGTLAAVVVDYAVLADEDVPRGAAARPRLTPRVALVPESGHLMPSVGLGGTF